MGQRLSSLINIDFQCFLGVLLVGQGLLLTVNALVLQVRLSCWSGSRLGHQSPHFRPRHLGHLVWSWGGCGGDGSVVLSLAVVSQVIGRGVEVGSLPPAGFLMLFPASVALE